MEANTAKTRKQYTGEAKLAILRKHHVEGVPVLGICDEYELQPTVFHQRCNGKIEPWHKSLKSESPRPTTPLSLADPQRVVREFAEGDNAEWQHSAIGYTTPQDQPRGT